MKKSFKIKKPKSNINGNCIIMFLLMVGLSSLAYAISVILAMIFIDGMFHWLLIFLFHFIAIFFIPPSLIISVLAYLLKLKKGFLNGTIIGLMYATLVVGGVAFHFSRDYGAPTINKEDSLVLCVAFVLCTIIGFVSARALPDEYIKN